MSSRMAFIESHVNIDGQPMVRLTPACKALMEVSDPPEPEPFNPFSLKQAVAFQGATAARPTTAPPNLLLPFFLSFLTSWGWRNKWQVCRLRDGGIGSFPSLDLSLDGSRHPGT